MTLNLTQSDIATRLRRWASVAGKASPVATDQVTLDATLAVLDKDPYQGEFLSYSVSAAGTVGVGNLSFLGLQNGSSGPLRGVPLVVVDRIDYYVTAAQAIQIILQRPSANTAIASLGLLSYQRGWPAGAISGAPGAQLVEGNAGGGVTGSQLYLSPTLTANVVVTFQPPQPIQLFPQQSPQLQGDVLYIQGVTTNTNVFATFYWREYSPFKY